MLKSSVPVLVFSLTLVIAQPSAANPGQPSLEPAKTALSSTSKSKHVMSARAYMVKSARALLNMSAIEDVAFAIPGKQFMPFADAYIRSNDESLTAVRQRSKRPFVIIDSILTAYDLPAELRYLAVIESDLKPTATSRVGAKGPWQLMSVTARDLGLKVNRRTDERTNYYKSTKAAALYLRDLHNQFKDWLLVLAAYNAGPLPVLRAIHRSHSRNFWVLQRYLPAESRQHVKRFLATAYYFNVGEPVDDPMCIRPGVDNQNMSRPQPAYLASIQSTELSVLYSLSSQSGLAGSLIQRPSTMNL
jgi:soluble lytic murein transglycosylase-like protein